MAEASGRIGKHGETITEELPLYYSGQMQKKDKGENLELHKLKSMEQVSSSKSPECDPIYKLKFPKQEVQLKFDNVDTAELWRGFILAVSKLPIPRLQLLPRQITRLREIQTAEEQRRAVKKASLQTPKMSKTPACFLKVSREKAEELLQQHLDCGSIILRPATDKPHYSITTRQVFPSGPLVNHYKIISSKSGYTIELDEPVTVKTLHQVVDHFVEKTANQLQPFTKSEPQPQCTLA
ncbi:signal-transducing adaptor protein 1-like [Sardina pilchardus]|uniref:signal-transducing adaptor protein 1-like n=1 Tax=Sardina pilchardus TaxID=27697 RepID=UPI002E14E742